MQIRMRRAWGGYTAILATAILPWCLAEAKQPLSAALTVGSIQKTAGPDWRVARIAEGFLLTSVRPVVFLPAVSPSTKKGFYQQIATARRDFMRIKILYGAPATDAEINSLSVNDFVLPIFVREASFGYYPCWDADSNNQRRYLAAPLYLVSNAGPEENIYPWTYESYLSPYDSTVQRIAKLCGFPDHYIIVD